MQRIINFLISNKYHLLFVFLFSLSIVLTVQSYSYHRSKYLNSANVFSGNIYSITHGISSYFGLKEKNQLLIEENKTLRRQLLKIDQYQQNHITPLVKGHQFEVIAAVAINNNYKLKNNYITLNKGYSDGLKQDMGVITSNGIIGIVENTSSGFATVQSILNTKSLINAKIKHTNYFGSLKWNNTNASTVQLHDIERFVPVKKGDTIITGGKSAIFPEGIPIGLIEEFVLNEVNGSFDIEVRLFNDMTNLDHVYIIKNHFQKEIRELEQKNENGQ